MFAVIVMAIPRTHYTRSAWRGRDVPDVSARRAVCGCVSSWSGSDARLRMISELIVGRHAMMRCCQW